MNTGVLRVRKQDGTSAPGWRKVWTCIRIQWEAAGLTTVTEHKFSERCFVCFKHRQHSDSDIILYSVLTLSLM